MSKDTKNGASVGNLAPSAVAKRSARRLREAAVYLARSATELDEAEVSSSVDRINRAAIHHAVDIDKLIRLADDVLEHRDERQELVRLARVAIPYNAMVREVVRVRAERKKRKVASKAADAAEVQTLTKLAVDRFKEDGDETLTAEEAQKFVESGLTVGDAHPERSMAKALPNRLGDTSGDTFIRTAQAIEGQTRAGTLGDPERARGAYEDIVPPWTVVLDSLLQELVPAMAAELGEAVRAVAASHLTDPEQAARDRSSR